jgi:putative membrane protein insertion efficiency factor
MTPLTPQNLMSSSARLALLGVIRAYQLTLSAAFGPCCRFYPSCSHYGYEAVARFGALRGGWLAAKRVGRCHPWHAGGEDPVPDSWPGWRNSSLSHDARDARPNSPMTRATRVPSQSSGSVHERPT